MNSNLIVNEWGLKIIDSAKILLPRKGKFTLFFILLITFYVYFVYSEKFLICFLIAANGLFNLAFICKIAIFFFEHKTKEHTIIIPNDRDIWPKYSIIIPIYQEKEIIPHLIESLNALDYPEKQTEILFAVEEDDAMTLNALNELKKQIKKTYKICVVPKKSKPKTKPNACNFALKFAVGKYITIYDAEDRPDPKQLKKIVLSFEQSAKEIQCIQCRLNFYNHDENWICALFSFEYTLLFDYVLPFFVKHNCPIPLGGTSNHFRTQFLKKIGAWDPFNVTEDADLGLRIFFAGFKNKVINSYTFEEATNSISSWINQRSRWLKGYLQTLLVLLRKDIKMNFRIKFSIIYLLIIPCIFSIILPLIIITILATTLIITPIKEFVMFFENLRILFYTNIFAYFFGYILIHSIYKKHIDIKNYLMIILYYVMTLCAGFKALWEIIADPHYWNKTNHGVSNFFKKKAT